MCGARRLHGQSRAAWFVVVVFFLLPLAMSRGEAPLIDPAAAAAAKTKHQEDSPRPSPASGGGEAEQELNRLGSRPPCCDRKCGACAPCTAVLRVRAAAGRRGPQCANYEPLGWKCKCGGAVFDP